MTRRNDGHICRLAPARRLGRHNKNPERPTTGRNQVIFGTPHATPRIPLRSFASALILTQPPVHLAQASSPILFSTPRPSSLSSPLPHPSLHRSTGLYRYNPCTLLTLSFCSASLLGLRTRLGRAGPAIAPSAHPPSARYPRPAPTPSTGVPLLSDPAPAGPAPPRTDPRLPSRACVPLGPARPCHLCPSHPMAWPLRDGAQPPPVLSVPNPMIQSCKSQWDLSPSRLGRSRHPSRTRWTPGSPSASPAGTSRAPRGKPLVATPATRDPSRGTTLLLSAWGQEWGSTPLGSPNLLQTPATPGPTRRSAGRKFCCYFSCCYNKTTNVIIFKFLCIFNIK